MSIRFAVQRFLIGLFVVGLMSSGNPFSPVYASNANLSDSVELRSAEYAFQMLRNTTMRWLEEVDELQQESSSFPIYNHLGSGTRYRYLGKSGQFQIVRVWRTADGTIFDIGMELLADSIRSQLDYTQQLAIQVGERIAWSLQTGNEAYTEIILSDPGIQLATNVTSEASVAAQDLHRRIGTDVLPGSIGLNSIDQEGEKAQFQLSIELESGQAIELSITPSASTLFNGRLAVYRSAILSKLTQVSNKTEAAGQSEDLFDWQKMYAIDSSNGIRWELPDKPPYQNKGALEASGAVIIPPNSEESLKGDSKFWNLYRYYWSSLAFPDSLQNKILWNNNEVRASIVIEENELPRFSKPLSLIYDRIGSWIALGQPVYFGIQSANVSKDEQRMEIEGVLTIVDPYLHVEHAFRIRDEFKRASSSSEWTWQSNSMRGVLAIRVDNLNNAFYEKERVPSDWSDRRKFSIKLTEN
jgi:hypothetical protein